MRNWYDNREYIVIHEPVTHRRGRTFERKLAEATSKGYELVGHPSFHALLITPKGVLITNARDYAIYGTVLLRRRKGRV